MMSGRPVGQVRPLLRVVNAVSATTQGGASSALRGQPYHHLVGIVRRNPNNAAINGAPSAPWRSRCVNVTTRFLSDGSGKAATQEDPLGDESQGESSAEDNTAVEEGEAEEVSREAELEKEVSDLKDQLLRSLAEQENTRRIAKRDVDQARSYAVTSFAKSLLDTSDNLTRALEAVPPEYRSDTDNHPVLATLYEGIKMTDENLTKAFAKNGLTKFGEVGEKFDPNKHEALFEYPDPNSEVGTVGQVMKIGFMLNQRVVRPAEVGVVKSP